LKPVLESNGAVKKSGATKKVRVKSARTQSEAPPALIELLASPAAAAVSRCVIELEGGGVAHSVERDGGARPGRAGPSVLGIAVIQIVPQMKILVALEAEDRRKGIDSLTRLVRES
jgi:hypothetical protein